MLQARRLATGRSQLHRRFCLARSVDRQLLSERAMHFGLREIVAAISAAALIFCCSCEKHHLGEDPEAQKEHVESAGAGEETSAAEKENAEPPAATKSATPVEFFPQNTPAP